MVAKMSSLFAMLYAAATGALTNAQAGADLTLLRGVQNPPLTAAVILLAGLVVVTAGRLST